MSKDPPRDFSVYRLDPLINERAFNEHVRRLAIEGGWHYYHTYRSDRSDPGFPDVVLARPGALIFAELKAEKGKPTPEQTRWLTVIGLVDEDDSPHVEVYLWRPSDFEQIARRLLS